MNKQAKANGGRGIEWKSITGYLGYEISSEGDVRSGWYPIKGGRKFSIHKKRVLSSRPRKKDGYQHLTLIDSCGKRRDVYIHDLVLTTFVGECPPEMECRHLDGNPGNNRLDNLVWGTRLENGNDKVIHGTSTRGEAHNTTKLTEDQVRDIKRRIAKGETDTQIAADFPVLRGQIYNIRAGTAWGWLNE